MNIHVEKEKMIEIIQYIDPFAYLLIKYSKEFLPFLNKQGEVKKADEEFITKIIEAASKNGVDELNMKIEKSQLSGLDITLKKLKKLGFDFDIGIKGDTSIDLKIKFKEKK
jgi:hypothetical protein